jgi:RNA polymerase sigma-70 factor (ECF subfamily)
VTLYDSLYDVMPTAVVAMNRAIALAETAGPQVALAQLDTLARELAGYHLLHASRATMLRRLGREKEAIHAFDLAIELAPGARERGFLDRQRGAGHSR